MSKLRNIDQVDLGAFLGHYGVPAFGKRIFCAPAGSATASYLADLKEGYSTSLATAYGQIVSGRNDTIFLSPDSNPITANLDWAASCSNLVGMYSPARMNHRSRISQSGTFTPMLTISGSGNCFANLYIQHGTASTDLVGTYITGNRNSFFNCHFLTPQDSAQASEEFKAVHATGAENYFKDCFFGNNTQSCDEASSMFYLGAGAGVQIFENCIFFMRVKASDTSPYFINIANTSDTGQIFLKDCLLIAEPTGPGGTPATAINIQSTGVTGVYCYGSTQFCHVTAITGATKDQYVYYPTVFTSTDDDVAMLMETPTLGS